MKKEFKLLKEWTVNYIKNRDILLKQIESINEKSKEWDVVVKTKTGEKYYLIRPYMEDFNKILQLLDGNAVTVVVLNTKDNLNILIENWDKLVDYPKFCILFANPYSELEKKWVIYPKTHQFVTEKSSFGRGLKALFQTVEPWKG
jgi:2-hydroxy-3-keto-5-methylthiopentenyl-1-phosphate phosphatase